MAAVELQPLAVSTGAAYEQVQVLEPRKLKIGWWLQREPFWGFLYLLGAFVFAFLSWVTTLSDLTYLSGDALLKFGIAWWVVLGVFTVIAVIFYIMDVRNSKQFEDPETKVVYYFSEVDKYERHMAFWNLFFFSLLGAIQIGLYYNQHGSTNVSNDAIAFVDYKVTFAFIATELPMMVIIWVRWMHHVREPMFASTIAASALGQVESIFTENAFDSVSQTLPQTELRGEISVRTVYNSSTGEFPTEPELNHKLLNRGVPKKYRGFYWTAAILSFLSILAFGLMWSNTLAGVHYLASDAVRPWLIVYSCVEGFVWVILLIFYLWILFAPRDMSIRVHDEIQGYFWGMTFAILVVFGGLLVFELDIGDFNVTINPSTYLDFKLMNVYAAFQIFFTMWVTARLLLLPAEFTWTAISTTQIRDLTMRTEINPEAALGKAGSHYSRHRKSRRM